MDMETYILIQAYLHSLQQNLGMRKILLDKFVGISDDKIAAETYWRKQLGLNDLPPVMTYDEMGWN